MNYEEKKQRLVKEFIVKTKKRDPVGLGKSTSNLFRHRKSSKSTINVREFNKVISIDKNLMTVEVEGMTTYEKLVSETLKQGVMPTVVPELKSITIGGAVTGLGIESSSFKYGLVHETVTEMEILLGDGKVVICTPSNQYKDLFFGFPNSYGTFGYALKLKVKIVPVKDFVKLTHVRYADPRRYFKELGDFCQRKKEFDFIDGTIFKGDEMYITLGQFSEEAPFVSDYTGGNIYYKSLRRKKMDYLKTIDYIWRWDTDWFWCSKHFGVQNKIVRSIIPKKFLKSTTYWKIRAWNGKYQLIEKVGKLFGSARKESIIQDIEIPIKNCAEFMDFFHKEIGIKPVWVCPVKTHDPTVNYNLYSMNPSLLYVNFGFWDTVKTNKEKGYYNRKIERKVKKLQGKKSLYSDVFYSEEEFWELYNKEAYDKLKRKYDSQGKLKNLYEKCTMK